MYNGIDDVDTASIDAVDDLVGLIDANRLTYPERDGGVTIEGAPFSVYFDTPVVPEVFCGTISTPEEPWKLFGIPHPLKRDYWKLAAVFLHHADTHPEGSSKATLEVAPEWARVYVSEGSSAERIADFVRTLDAEYGVEVRFADD